ncbi:hypothetical protein AURDEDRAFT_164670 [Auricularia subglabra TFB-10046 SS5]|nr:hypothetical protein AURDEDRAFT_164670 [Auricularia subglabra TFB-10046 SS5]
MFKITASLVLFVALASSVVAAPGAGTSLYTAAPGIETKAIEVPVAEAVTPSPHLRTTEAAANGTLNARGLHINFGETSSSEVVWASGDSKCSAIVLTSRGLNPCGRKFSLHGIGGLTLEGCGGGLWINQNGKFYEGCTPFSEADACGVHTEWTCA